MMRRNITAFSLVLVLIISLSGCRAEQEKPASISVAYLITALLAALLLLGCCLLVKMKDGWFLLLFSSVLVVNTGYFWLAVSPDLEQALMANRLAYLGSVFLPFAMLMIILRVTHIRVPKWLPGVLVGLGALIFLVAASPGFLPIYYKEVFCQRVGGVTVLKKVYGPLHSLYLVYLLGYFSAMVTVIVYATVKDKIDSVSYAAILTIAVFVNIGVWLIEQMMENTFEILSVSYIISESFLLGLHLFLREMERQKEALQKALQQTVPQKPKGKPGQEEQAQLELFAKGLSELTPKEQSLFGCYVEGMTTAAIMEKLNIKENTLKYHNKNLYSKLGVSSRKQLVELHKRMTG